jgi:hypothetical protein
MGMGGGLRDVRKVVLGVISRVKVTVKCLPRFWVFGWAGLLGVAHSAVWFFESFIKKKKIKKL